MKSKLILLLPLFILIFCFESNGQLQYNGVKLISSSASVPPGKVWKIESILCNQYEMVNVNISGPRILVNGNTIFFVDHSSPCLSSDNAFFPSMLPMWLPENTTIAPSTGVTYISVIEFNIVI
jgi:hypothetical protein